MKSIAQKILLFFIFLSTNAYAQPHLKTFSFNAAAVLPYTEYQGETYVLVARETRGSDKGTWDSFGGSRDGHEKHPVITAGREFAEETAYALFTPQQAHRYIDVDTGNTSTIIAYGRKQYVLYITHFAQQTIRKLADAFYSRIAIQKKNTLTEKDLLALVKLDTIKHAVISCRNKQGVLNQLVVDAQILTPTGTTIHQTIKLRPILISVLEPYFKDSAYTSGKNKIIRFY